MKIIMIGTTMKVEPAICRANWLSFCPLSSDSPTDKVYSFSSFAIMSGHKKLFHPPMKVRMACTAIIGVEMGSTICKKCGIPLLHPDVSPPAVLPGYRT